MASFFKKHKQADKAAGTATGKKQGEKPQDKAASASAIPPTGDDNEPAPLLDDDDEQFLERLVSNKDDEGDEEGPPPPLPPRPKTPVLTWDSDAESGQQPVAEANTSTTAAATTNTTTTPAPALKKPNPLSRLFRRNKQPASSTLTVNNNNNPPVPAEEADREWADLNGMLARLDIIAPTPPPAATAPASQTPSQSKPASKPKSAALSASAEVQTLLRQFVQILKDITRGAPAAASDLAALLDGRNDALRRGFERLPGPMRRLVTQLPRKITSALGPEVLAAAAEAQGLRTGSGSKSGQEAGLAARLLAPWHLGELAVTPAIVQSMLKAIVNALKARWPAFVGTNVLWSAAVVLLLFVLWYCHKRGKEEREKMEAERAKAEAEAKDVTEPKDVAEEQAVDGDGPSTAVVVVDPPADRPRV
ncbi:8243dd74-c6f4-49cb-b7e7-0b5604fd25fd [Thermothielavioides terrestris]|uniref:8243dd74-c6f4-49cb-b7e7-0b5604fd25fd n=1 Tax=Thermothielavioides terrestris TaxID=2587410 RepID=A0A446BRP6_9PEZI|nr:8243dd74-c6f4-49cb-b7e7-0b5604fd25fd [Thermothielavioides terrestris]